MPLKINLRGLLALYQLCQNEQERSYVRMVNTKNVKKGEYHSFIQILRNFDEGRHEYFRMSEVHLDEVLEMPIDIDLQ